MIGYYFRLAFASFRRTPGLGILMILAVGIGIGVCVVTLTFHHAMSGNPIWWKSDQLYAVTLDNWDPMEPADPSRPSLPPDQVTYRDAEFIYHSDVPKHAAIMYRSFGIVSGDGVSGPLKPAPATTRITTGTFFPMFDVPFEYGKGWNDKADFAPEPVMVISHELNRKLFGGINSVGRTIRWNDTPFRIVGVLAEWEPQPKFYDMNSGDFDSAEDLYIPWKWGEVLEVGSDGSSSCWKIDEDFSTLAAFARSECVWIQAWVELPNFIARARMQSVLDNYTGNEHEHGRFLRPRNNRLTDVDQWLKDQKVVPTDNRVLFGLSFVFLAVCLINTVGLLLAKFLNAAPISGLRRALGASRRELFRQHMVEVSTIAGAGALLGLGIGALGLAGVRALYMMTATTPRPSGIASIAHMDISSYLIAVTLAVVATVVCGLYPAWRVGRLQPASYLKNQ
ncbi:MAG: ABC transporter permease [Gammaproteobacteria bacterium]